VRTLISNTSKFFDMNLAESSLTELSSTIIDSGYFFSDITFGPNGLLYASNIADATKESLVTLDPDDSTILSILPYTGPTQNYSSTHAIAFSPTGDLYLMNQGRLSRVNMHTGATTYLTEYLQNFKAITFSPDGELLGLDISSSSAIPDEIWKISLEDLSVSLLGLSHGSIDTMRFGPDGPLFGVTSNPYPDARVLVKINPEDGSYVSIGLNPPPPRNVSKLPVEPAISGLWDR